MHSRSQRKCLSPKICLYVHMNTWHDDESKRNGKKSKAEAKLHCALCANIFEAGLTCTALTGRAINILPTKAVNIGCLPQFSSLCDDKRKNSLEMLGKQKRIKNGWRLAKWKISTMCFPIASANVYQIIYVQKFREHFVARVRHSFCTIFLRETFPRNFPQQMNRRNCNH